LFRNILNGSIYSITGISILYNPILVDSFCNTRIIQQERFSKDASTFTNKAWANEHNALRDLVYNTYMKRTTDFTWNTPDSVPILLAVHGTSTALSEKISRTGFAVLCNLDVGWYGKGIYLSTHAGYCFPYISTKKDPVLIITYVLPGNIYPVIENVQTGKLLGSALLSGYQSHYVCTKQNGCPPDTIAEMKSAVFDELIVAQESQILPVFIIKVSNDNFNLLTERWKRNIPETDLDSTISVVEE